MSKGYLVFTRNNKFRRCRIIAYVALASTLAMSGCASVRVVAREENPKEVEDFLNLRGWSLDFEGGKEVIQRQDKATLGSFEVHSSYWYAWGTVLSFGWWIPFDITYEENK